MPTFQSPTSYTSLIRGSSKSDQAFDFLSHQASALYFHILVMVSKSIFQIRFPSVVRILFSTYMPDMKLVGVFDFEKG